MHCFAPYFLFHRLETYLCNIFFEQTVQFIIMQCVESILSINRLIILVPVNLKWSLGVHCHVQFHCFTTYSVHVGQRTPEPGEV